jgi:hypothetical protein
MAKVLFSYGVKANYLALSAKDENTLYFITDSQEIFKGSQLIADKTKLNVSFVDAIPTAETSVPNVLYVATVGGKTTMWIKNGDSMIQAGGGEATEIADGVITISKFADGTVATTLDAASDSTIPTSKAVADAIANAVKGLDGAFVDVSAEAAPEGSTGTVIKFTAKDGSTKQVTVADIFLASATYDNATHKLKLTLNDAASSIVEVDLSDLIGNSLSDVVVGQDEAFTVELGPGGTLGGFKTGDKVSKDMTAENIVKKLLMKQVPPTYTQPSVSISNNGGSASGSYEIGSTVTPKVRATFTQNDAGAVTSIQFQKNSSDVGDAQSSAPATYEETGFVLESTTSFRAVVNYAEGAVKKDNLGQDYPDGHIQAGSKTTSNYTFTPYRQGYFVGSTVDKATLTSSTIRDMTKKNGAYSAQTIEFTVPVGAGRVVIACPATSTGLKKVINTSALNADVTSTFVKSTLDIEGADGYSAITYNVWTFIPDVAYGQKAVLAFTLG